MASLPPTSSSTHAPTPQLEDAEFLAPLGTSNGYNTINPEHLYPLDSLLTQAAPNLFSIGDLCRQCGIQDTSKNMLTYPQRQPYDITSTQPPVQAQALADCVALNPFVFSREEDLVGATSTPQSTGAPHPEVFKCKWEGCQHSGIFSREAELMRHVKAIHVSPRSFTCPARGCRRVFNRKDNMKDHLFRKHDGAQQIWIRVRPGPE